MTSASITAHSRMRLITADGLTFMVPTPAGLTSVPVILGRTVTPNPCPTCGMSADDIPPRQYAFEGQQGNVLVYREITP